MAADLWNVILAAGNGRRLTPVTQGTPEALGLAVYSWGQSIGWSDLGTPDRLYQWLDGTRAELSA